MSVLRDDRGVVDGLAAPAALVLRDAAEDQHDVARHGDELVANFERGVDEHVAIEQIARRVTGDRELRHHDDIGACFDAVFVCAANQLGIRAERADRRVDLPDVDLQIRQPFALNYV